MISKNVLTAVRPMLNLVTLRISEIIKNIDFNWRGSNGAGKFYNKAFV